MGQWHKAAALDEVQQGKALAVDVADKAIALYRFGDEIHAAGDWCPHEEGVRLSDGYLDGDTIECPMHQSCFSVKTGAVLCSPARSDIPIYPVRIDGRDVMVEIGD